MAPEGKCPDNLPIIIGAAVGGVLLGVLITCIVFIVLYRRKKCNCQIKRSEPTKHRSGLSAQDNRVVSNYDSNATYVNEIPCVALATAKQPDKASYVNGCDVNALTNEYEHLTEEKETANQNAPTSDDDGAYTTINLLCRNVRFLRCLERSNNRVVRCCFQLVQNGSRSTVSRSFFKLCDVTQKSRHHIVESVCHPTALFKIGNDHEEMAGLVRDLLALRAGLELDQNLSAHDIELLRDINFSIRELCTH
ncbi:hypothetical protein CAPTEDRAFT_203696 [Capitella teleta]|uniref:Uncharacterized protein n=1 Tax=Capitella teleta TaxID=283909 RepID=R7T3S4_CAPTE|nr:hypothetical protein CAPTEDRAFT_203696 [Capitella teleta]|eukprot:ELT87398.1 hypothetical protein CAPTEDRAFT_203696 [Capitella teleta]